MYQVFYQENSIIIMNDNTEKTKLLTDKEMEILFNDNPLLEDLKEKKTKRIFLDNVRSINSLP